LRALVHALEEVRAQGVALPRVSATPEDPTGMNALAEGIRAGFWSQVAQRDVVESWWYQFHSPRAWGGAKFVGFDRSWYHPVGGREIKAEHGSTLDAWGRPALYRCPGPVHRSGWDVYSLGPDGKDDGGQGDDVLLGSDDAGPVSR
jgi:hypothetical protein